ncbi:MAG: double-stranded DNA-binding protein [Thermoproteota archaeon]|nr:double-stranded DNA-binding protein [Thermoproteota archaeon]
MVGNNKSSEDDLTVDDPDLELIKARKMKALQQQIATKEKERKNLESDNLDQKKHREVASEKDFLLRYLYDRGNEVLSLGEQQFPFQTKVIIQRLNELIRNGEIPKVSGGELLAVYRSLGLNIRINTNISISDHGKTISFSEKLRQNQATDGEQ